MKSGEKRKKEKSAGFPLSLLWIFFQLLRNPAAAAKTKRTSDNIWRLVWLRLCRNFSISDKTGICDVAQAEWLRYVNIDVKHNKRIYRLNRRSSLISRSSNDRRSGFKTLRTTAGKGFVTQKISLPKIIIVIHCSKSIVFVLRGGRCFVILLRFWVLLQIIFFNLFF